MTLDDLLGPEDEENQEDAAEVLQSSETESETDGKTDSDESEIDKLLREESEFQKQLKDKTVEKKVKDTTPGHNRSRIRNITEIVHPQEDSKEKQAEKRASKAEAEAKKARRKLEKKAQKAEEKIRLKEILAQRKERQKKYRYRRFVNYAAGFALVIAIIFMGYNILNYNTGNRHDAKGLSAYENGDYDTAVSEFKEAVSYDDENADYYIHLGMAYIENGSYDEALGYFNQAENCAQSDEQKILIGRGRGIACLCQGDYASAIDYFDAALNSGADKSVELNLDMMYYKAEAEYKSGNYTDAIAQYTQIVSQDDNVDAYLLRSEVYEAMEDYGNQENDLRKAISMDKKNYSIYRSLYNALIAQGKTDDAAQVISDALELSGSSAEDLFNKGMLYAESGDVENASDYLEKSYDKGCTEALLGLAQIDMDQQNYEDADQNYAAYFDKIDTDSENKGILAKAYNQYAVCLLNEEKYQEAIEACQSGLALGDRSTDSELSMNLISAYEHTGEWTTAYNTARSYVEKYPDDASGAREYTFLETRVSQ